MFNRVNCSFSDQLVFSIFSLRDLGNDFFCHRSMIISINLDMPIQIIFERLTFLVLGQIFQKTLKHCRNRFFSPIEEWCRYVRSRLTQRTQCVQDKVTSMFWDVFVFKAFLSWFSSNQICCKLSDNLSIGSNLIHCINIEFKMGNVIMSIRMNISFFPNNNFIYEPSSIRRRNRNPNWLDTG